MQFNALGVSSVSGLSVCECVSADTYTIETVKSDAIYEGNQMSMACAVRKTESEKERQIQITHTSI